MRSSASRLKTVYFLRDHIESVTFIMPLCTGIGQHITANNSHNNYIKKTLAIENLYTICYFMCDNKLYTICVRDARFSVMISMHELE